MKDASTIPFKKIFGTATMLRTRDMVEKGVPRWRVSQAEKAGRLTRIARGLYALPGTDVSEQHTLALVARLVPKAAICLLSALRFHDLTPQNPHEIWIAITPWARKPAITYPPIRVVRFSPDLFALGLEKHQIEDVTVKVYSVARTVVDLFRYRNKIGIDVALEALKEGWKDRRFKLKEVNQIAESLRMSTIMRPYLESLVA